MHSVRTIRRAKFDDSGLFTKVVQSVGGPSSLKALYGQFQFTSLIEYSYLSILAHTEDNCFGFASFNDTVADIENLDEVFVELKQCIPHILPINTIFLNFWVIDINISFDLELGDAIMRKTFDECPEVEYVLWIASKTARLTNYMRDRFIEVDLEGRTTAHAADPLREFRVFAMHRSRYFPKLQIREARVEDNDDLLPLLSVKNPHIIRGHEDYFLADLIQAQDSRNSIFVGIDNNVPVGMLAASLDVNVNLVSKIFDLDCYGDLIMHTQSENKGASKALICVLSSNIECLNNVMIAAPDIGCCTVDADEINFDDFEDHNGEVNYQDLVKEIETRVDAAFQQPLAVGEHSGCLPIACVLLNFPKTGAEARALVELLKVDAVIEFTNDLEPRDPVTGAVDDDGTWEGMIDVLRNNLHELNGLIETSIENPIPSTENSLAEGEGVEWVRIPTEDNIIFFFNGLSNILNHLKLAFPETRANPAEKATNGFALTVFCMKNEYESRAVDLLKAAFEEYPDLDYCLFMQPNDSPPTNLTRLMSLAKLRAGISFDQSLYVLHRQTLAAKDYFHINRLKADDESELLKFLQPIDGDGSTWTPFIKSALKENDVSLIDNPSEVCFIARCEEEIVGFMTISRRYVTTEDVNWFRANYEIDELVCFDRHRGRAQAIITEWVMSPIFSRWSRYMLREVMRYYGKTLLYYQCPENSSPPLEVINELVPVRPKSRVEAPPKSTITKFFRQSALITEPLVERPSKEAGCGNSCPLYFITKNLLITPRIPISTRVVILGGCLSVYAALENFVFVPHLRMTNIYLIMESPPTAVRRNFNPNSTQSVAADDFSGCLSLVNAEQPLEQMVKAMGFNNHVNIIRGKLTDIDRTNKAIVVSDETVVEYDVLLLAPALQDLSFTHLPDTNKLNRVKAYERGVFGLGAPFDDRNAVRWIKRRADDNEQSAVIIYGKGLEAWNAIGKLLYMNIIEDRSRIQWIIPDHDLPDLGNDQVENLAMESLLHSYITIWRGYKIDHINFSPDNQSICSIEITHVKEETEKKEGEEEEEEHPEEEISSKIPCFAFLGANEYACPLEVFNAVNDCGLVYDGGIVVNSSFCTVDPAIYAVGDTARFSRLYKDIPVQSKLNAYQLGSHCANEIINRHLDPFSNQVVYLRNATHLPQAKTAASAGVPPSYFKGRSYLGFLPGNLHYFRATLLTKPRLTSEINTKDNVPNVMVTKSAKNGDACVIKCDSLGILNEIIYIGWEVVEARNLFKLLGWHESFLNNMQMQYASGEVEDWMTFFRLTGWVAVVCHDKFPDFAANVRELLKTDQGVFAVLDSVFEIAEISGDEKMVVAKRRDNIGENGELLPLPTRQLIESSLTEFIRKNKTVLTHIYLANQTNNTAKAKK